MVKAANDNCLFGQIRYWARCGLDEGVGVCGLAPSLEELKIKKGLGHVQTVLDLVSIFRVIPERERVE